MSVYPGKFEAAGGDNAAKGGFVGKVIFVDAKGAHVDVAAKLADLEARVKKLETPGG